MTHRPTVANHPSDRYNPRSTVESEVVYRGRIWNVVQDRFRLDDGTEPLVRDYIEHPGAVAVLVLNGDGEILLINQYRQPTGMNLWEVPAGLLDVEGEDFHAAAARELAEEADLTARTWHVLVDLFNSPGSSSEAIRIYLARDISDVPNHQLHERTDEEAEIELAWVPLDDAVEAVLSGRIHSISSAAGILAAAAARGSNFENLRPHDASWPAHPSQRRLWNAPDSTDTGAGGRP